MAPKVVMTMADWRLDVLLEPERTGRSVTEVCERHEISRDTFYAWKRRFEAVGLAGLLERSREPLHQPNKITPELEELICTFRRQHPRWGAKTIRSRIKRSGVPVPSISTVHRVLVRNNLVTPQPRKKPKSSWRRFERPEPNDLWQMDATEFDLADGKTMVVSVLDDHARFLLATVMCATETGAAKWEAFVTAATAYGLPRQVLTDNHPSTTGKLIRGEVDFERKLHQLRVQLITGRPRHPQTQGKIERYHRTLHEFTEDRDVVTTEELELALAEFRRDYNDERPHQGIGDLTPSERYRPSPNVFDPRVLAGPDYPAGTIVRRVYGNGDLSYRYMKISVGKHLVGQRVAIVPCGDEITIYHGAEIIRRFVPDPTVLRHRRPRSFGGKAS